ncbi:hypothetical protein CYY_009758 [Polysphondylium violaceum]|uniref:TRAF-type domain-containing protein n=1 Tax=Polysphondylium violaceum TaxID=133409 RepID=A0A8J4V2M8_9MYCE|nr:hypothetical protein CYY_009758 [Polysphondylium violaceum]
MPIFCKLWCTSETTRAIMAKHIEDECPKGTIPCPFLTMGCKDKFQRSTLAAHIALYDYHSNFIQSFSSKNQQLLDQSAKLQLYINSCNKRNSDCLAINKNLQEEKVKLQDAVYARDTLIQASGNKLQIILEQHKQDTEALQSLTINSFKDKIELLHTQVEVIQGEKKVLSKNFATLQTNYLQLLNQNARLTKEGKAHEFDKACYLSELKVLQDEKKTLDDLLARYRSQPSPKPSSPSLSPPPPSSPPPHSSNSSPNCRNQ